MASKSNDGYCPICRSASTFIIYGDSLRDQYKCNSCSSIPRQRHLQHILDSRFPGWEEKDLHEGSPSNNFIKQYSKRYTSSQYLPWIPFGSLSPDGVQSEDLERLSFPSEHFDIFVTQDVLEHVFDPALALQEIARCLRPGGIHIFTCPRYDVYERSFRRASVDASGDICYQHEPMYHGNPVGDGKSLVTWDYGRDFEFLVTQWSQLVVSTFVTVDRGLGIDAPINDVFVARKSA